MNVKITFFTLLENVDLNGTREMFTFKPFKMNMAISSCGLNTDIMVFGYTGRDRATFYALYDLNVHRSIKKKKQKTSIRIYEQ